MDSTLRLDGRIVFITGSTRGIGWATARCFAGCGATVILNHRGSASILEDRCHELEAEFHGTATGLVADVTEPAAVKNCYAEIFKRFKRLDVLVNNAGILQGALLGMITDESMHAVINTNLIGSLIHLQEASRLMARNRQGSIINVSSIFGRVGSEGHTVYAASKAAVIGMTLSAAKELAPKNIRVNAVAPGFIDTEMTRHLPPDKFQQRMQGIHMGRIGTPEEVAQAIVFLASDLSSYVTGQVLGVDGGMVL
jgi:3-oxoacyl-[acyl-carrier protein] reductase